MPSSVKLARPLVMERLEVEKIRQPKRCPRRTIYFFGNHEDYSHGDKQLYMDMVRECIIIQFNSINRLIQFLVIFQRKKKICPKLDTLKILK